MRSHALKLPAFPRGLRHQLVHCIGHERFLLASSEPLHCTRTRLETPADQSIPQIHAVGLKGFGGKAANVLGKLAAGDPALLALLHALLQPADIAALVRTAARGAKAQDIEVGHL